MKLGLIVDDHALFAEGMLRILAAIAHGWHFDCATSLLEARRRGATVDYELVLLDWNLETEQGASLLAAVRTAFPNARIVVVSGETGFAVVRAAIDGGACGFIPKTTTSATVAAALTAVAQGRIFLPNIVAFSPAQNSMQVPKRPPDVSLQGAYPALTIRQCDVLRQLIRGLTNRQISHRLSISDSTTKIHVAAIFRALDVATRSEAVYLLAKQGVNLD